MVGVGVRLNKSMIAILDVLYFHNNVIHKILRQSGMERQLEIEDYFINKVREMVISPENIVPILNKNLKGYLPDGRQLGIACGKFPAGIDPLTEVKVIHNGTIQYMRPNVRDDSRGGAAVEKYQRQIRGTYLASIKRKDKLHFRTEEGARGPLETIFGQIVFKPLVFETFGETSSIVRELVEIAVKYGAKHLGMNMAAPTINMVRATLRRRYRTQLSMAARKGYANLVLDRTKYVGTGRTGSNRAQIRQEMVDGGDKGEHDGIFMVHETGVALRDAFPS